MWSALGMYALRETWREKKKLRKMRRKHKEKQKVIIPNELFYSEEASFLPTFEEVKIQEEHSYLYDAGSPDEYSQYTKFEYSMGGNVKMYDNHITLTSPKKKLNKPLDTTHQNLDKTMDNLNDSTMSSVKDSVDDSHKLEGDDLDFRTSRLRDGLGKLELSDVSGRRSRKALGSDSLEDFDMRKRVDSRERDYSPIRDTSTKNLERKEDFSSTETKSKVERDYSPIHSTNKMLPGSSEYYQAKTSQINKQENAVIVNSGERPNEHASGVNGQSLQKNIEGDINVLESMSRYDLTLHYVNQQNKTLQNGDYNDLDIALSDLSSDVFTDSELQFTLPESNSNEWTKRRPDKDFYPDSPVSECAYFKTPCSSRKNSYDSLISDESLTDMETDARGNIQAPIRRSLAPVNGHNGHNGHMNGITNGHVKTKGKGLPLQNGKVKMQNGPKKIHEVSNGKTKSGTNNKTGKGKILNKKADYSKTTSKINSFRKVNHVPGGGTKKVNNGRMNHYKNVEPRTDTHGVEAYSHLPPEFQEIARRLSRQDKSLRETEGKGHPRSRLTSRSSRGGSVSPRDRSPGRHGNLAKQYGNNMSASSLSLTSTASAKRRRSLHPRPVTPSLSRSHPATSCTLYDSRSRPSSRQASRSSSPVRSRNSSPSRLRSRNGSISSNRLSRGSSPNRERRSRKSSASGGSGYETPHSDRSKSRNRTGSRSRLDDNRPSTPVMDILSYSTSRSLFQVVPVHR